MAVLKFIRPSGLTRAQWMELAGRAREVAQEETPYDTGHLSESWSEPVVTSRSLEMVNTAEYAGFVDRAETPHGSPSKKQLANAGYIDRAKSTLGMLAGK